MANREALRDLQSRLASRLQAAKAEGLSISWLAVRAGGQDYLTKPFTKDQLLQAVQQFGIVSQGVS